MTLTINYSQPNLHGEFLITSSDGWATGIAANYHPQAILNNGFLSFCLERQELFWPGQSYSYSISDRAVKGGESISDPVSVGTGYLYSLFATGQIASNPELMQQTIWYLEDEANSPNPGVYDLLLSQKFGSVAASKMDFVAGESAATYGVQVINLGESPNYAGQDQLVYGAPETATWMAGTVLVALVAITKWRSR